jgi:hypothetical protein
MQDLKTLISSFSASTKPLSYGRQHTIYQLTDRYVIKIPRTKLLEPQLPLEQIKEDLALLKTYFPDFMLKTEVYPDQRYGYVIIQEYIPHLTALGYPELETVRNEFEFLIALNRSMRDATNVSLDYFGHLGLLKTFTGIVSNNKRLFCLSNIAVDPQTQRIVILDTNLSLLTPKRKNRWMMLQFLVDIVSYYINKILLCYCFNLRS